ALTGGQRVFTFVGRIFGRVVLDLRIQCIEITEQVHIPVLQFLEVRDPEQRNQVVFVRWCRLDLVQDVEEHRQFFFFDTGVQVESTQTVTIQQPGQAGTSTLVILKHLVSVKKQRLFRNGQG